MHDTAAMFVTGDKRTPGSLGDALDELRFLVSRRHLVVRLTANHLRLMYTNTALGMVWWFASPFLDALVYYFLVAVIFRNRADIFPLFILAAILPWRCFLDGIFGSVGSLVTNKRLLQQVRFPKSATVVSTVLSAHISFLFALPVLLVLQALYGTGPSRHILAVFPLLIAQTMLATGVALVLSCANVYFRDTENLTRYFFRFFFFLSPSLYAASTVPQAWQSLYRLNPFCTIFEGMRACLLYGGWPGALDVGRLLVVSAVVLVLGFVTFCRLERTVTRLL